MSSSGGLNSGDRTWCECSRTRSAYRLTEPLKQWGVGGPSWFGHDPWKDLLHVAFSGAG